MAMQANDSGVVLTRTLSLAVYDLDGLTETYYRAFTVEPADLGRKLSEHADHFLQQLNVDRADVELVACNKSLDLNRTLADMSSLRSINFTFHLKLGPYMLIQELRKPQPDEAVIKDMIRKGAKIDHVTAEAGTALHAVAHSPSLMRLLLDETVKKGVKVNGDVEYEGVTPLRAALLHADGEEVAIMLLDAGTSMTAAVNHDGDTVLHAAAYSGWKKLVKRALDAGLDSMDEWDGKNSLQWAMVGKQDRRYGTKGIQDNHDEIIAMMKQPKGGAPAAKKEAGQRRQRAEEADE